MACCGKSKKKTVIVTDDCDNEVVITSTESSDAADSEVTEDSSRNNLYVAIDESFNMPACGETADVVSPDAARLTSGTILYNSTVGFLLVTQIVDSTTLRVKNECSECNVKEPGESISGGLLYSIGNPACGSVGSGVMPSATTPFLDSDYVIPADESEVTIKVTNTFGLSIGDTVSIANHEYEVTAILDGTTIKIMNHGDGGTVGTLVEDDPNSDGSPDYPVVRIGGQNPCTTAAVSTAKRLVGCNGTNQEVGLVGTVTGGTMMWDGSEWVEKVINDSATCYALVCCLTLDPSNIDTFEYLIEIIGGTDFINQELGGVSPNPLRITIGDDAFCLTEVVDDDHVKVRPAFDVTEIAVYEEGAPICISSCCDQCTASVETLNRSFDDEPKEDTASAGTTTIVVPNGVSVVTLPGGIGSAGTGATGAGLTDLSYSNEESCACEKFLKVWLGYEISMTLPASVNANIELRLVKQLPIFDNQNFAAFPVYPNANLAGLDGSPNLLIGGNPGNYYNLETHKGFVLLRDFLSAGEIGKYVSHIRIVFRNSTGADANVSYAYSLVQWLEAQVWKIASVP